jgi:hypothetical protein
MEWTKNKYKSTVHSQFLLNNIFRKNWWNALIWVTGHCNQAAVSRNRYGVEKTVDTHKIFMKQELLVVAMFVNRSERNEQSS